MLENDFTRAMSIEHPIVCAGMAFVGTPMLAASISNAGALGAIGTALVPPEALSQLIGAVRSLTARPFSVNFITPFATDEHIEMCATESPAVVSFHWENPKAEWVARLQDAGTSVWAQVGSPAMAARAADSGVNAIIAQGLEAGGHNLAQAGVMALVPVVVDEVAPVPVIAAGGIADGRGLVAALALGAKAACIGTRFVATVEAGAHDEYKRRIVAAGVGDTALQTMFGPEWPDARNRAIRNQVVRQWEGREREIPAPSSHGDAPDAGGSAESIGRTLLGGQEYRMPRFSAALPTPDTTGDFEQMCMVAGESVGLIDDVPTASEVVRRIMDQARDVIRQLQ